MRLMVEVSVGELLDKITILELKLRHIDDPHRRANVERELAALTEAWRASGIDPASVAAELDALRAVNARLWSIEDEIRACEAEQRFDERFIELARSVYRTNDERARLKRALNERTGSRLVEEKHYREYGAP